MEKQLYEIIGRLYVDVYGGQQMLNRLQTLLTQKDEEIKELKGKLVDKELDDEGSRES